MFVITYWKIIHFQRSPVEVANEIAMLRRASSLGNSDDGNERRNIK